MPRNPTTPTPPPTPEKTQETPELVGAREVAAQLSEETGADVEVLDPRWRRYAQEGVVVKVSAGYERFQYKMTLKDIGIVVDDIDDEEERKRMERQIKPGDLYLIPWDRARKLAREAERARENLRRWGTESFFGQWIHAKTFATWQQGQPVVEGAERKDADKGHDEIVADFLRERDAIIADLPELIEVAAQHWIVLAKQNWEQLKGTSVEKNDPDFWNQDKWVAARVEALRAKLPDAETIVRKCYIRHRVTMIPTSEQVQIDLIRSGDRRLEAAEAAMMRELRETARNETRNRVEQFVTEVQGKVLGQVFDAVSDALVVIRKRPNGAIGRNNSIALSKMLEAVDKLDFWTGDDDSFRQNREALRALLGTDS